MQKPDWLLTWSMVFLQFIALGLIIFTGPLIKIAWWAHLIVLVGVFIGLWAIYTIRLGNFNISPYVKEGGIMVAKGPYRYIRHPMYTGLILISYALVAAHFTPLRLLFVILLTLALVVKLHLEEKLLKKAFQPYKEYTKKTKKLIPFIW